MPTLAEVAALREQVVHADADVLDATAAGWTRAGAQAAQVATRAARADELTAQNFRNGGAVYDAAAATAATRAALGDSGEHLDQVGRAVQVVADELRATQSGVSREWNALLIELDGINQQLADLTGPIPRTTLADPVARAQQLQAQADQALASHGGAIATLVQAYDAIVANRSSTFTDVGFGDPATDPHAAAIPPPPGTPPAQVGTWWRELSPTQQAQMIHDDPTVIGNLDGIPTQARDQANRITLGHEITRYESTQEGLQAQLDQLPPPGTRVSPTTGDLRQDLTTQLSAVTARLDALRAIDTRLTTSGPRPAYLMGFQPDAGRNGKAIVAVGNPDTADNVVTSVPGTYATLNTLPGDIKHSDQVADSASRAAPDKQTAVVTWLGYDAPQSIPVEAGQHSFADAAEVPLRDFQDGLRVTHQGPPSRNTVFGHSYGSTVVGQTARDQPLNADALIFAGSPGVGVDHVEDLHRPPGTVYSTTSDADVIHLTHSPLLGVFDDELGRDPSTPEFGAHVFRSDPTGDHGAYWNRGSPSLRSFGLIAVGKEPDS